MGLEYVARPRLPPAPPEPPVDALGTWVLLGATAAGLPVWGFAVRDLLRGRPVFGTRGAVTVGPAGLLLALAVFLLSAVSFGSPDGFTARLMLHLGRGLIAAAVLCLGWRVLARPGRGEDGEGETPPPPPTVRALADVRAGLAALLLALPPVVGVLLLAPLFKERTVADGHDYVKALVESPGALAWVLAGVNAVVVAPIREEVLFRGFIQGGLRSVGMPAWAAVGVVSVGFGATHTALQDLAALFLLSLVLGWVREETGRVTPAILAHAGFNALMLLQTATL